MPKDQGPKSSETSVDGWFAKHEEELLRQARRERQRREKADAAAQDESIRKAHWMKCPKCGHDLTEENIDPVTIDRCGQCEGIFLDRGELEEILMSQAAERRGLFRRILGLGKD